MKYDLKEIRQRLKSHARSNNSTHVILNKRPNHFGAFLAEEFKDRLPGWELEYETVYRDNHEEYSNDYQCVPSMSIYNGYVHFTRRFDDCSHGRNCTILFDHFKPIVMCVSVPAGCEVNDVRVFPYEHPCFEEQVLEWGNSLALMPPTELVKKEHYRRMPEHWGWAEEMLFRCREERGVHA